MVYSPEGLPLSRTVTLVALPIWLAYTGWNPLAEEKAHPRIMTQTDPKGRLPVLVSCTAAGRPFGTGSEKRKRASVRAAARRAPARASPAASKKPAGALTKLAR